jgi:hypothetical protein
MQTQKAENMKIQDVIRLLKIANSDIPSIEYKCRELEREEVTLRVIRLQLGFINNLTIRYHV